MKIITTLFLLIFTGYVNAQTLIKGSVQDENKSPLEAASISLIKGTDTLSFKNEVSNKEGKYSFSAIPAGSYYIRISSIGHVRVDGTVFTVVSGMKTLELPAFNLQKQNNELASVAVVGKKPFIEQKSDRILVNVDASPANAGTSVMDVLEKSPGVSVDKDGNISLKGKQGVTIMIDNRPTYMSGAQLAIYLKSLPSSAIDQLEIMSNPSSKYDAAGNSGIINIKTKKNKAKGFNGSVTLTHTQGVYPKPSASLNLNYKTGKANFFFNGGYSHWEGYQNLDINRNYLDSTSKNITSIFTQHTAMKFTNPEFNAKFGMDYYVSDRT